MAKILVGYQHTVVRLTPVQAENDLTARVEVTVIRGPEDIDPDRRPYFMVRTFTELEQ